MNIALRIPRMTREQFFPWAAAQEGRFEFDGFEPIPMTGGNARHSLVCQNLWAVLRGRLRDSVYWSTGPDFGLATVGNTVRYPDALVTAAKVPGKAHLAPEVVVVFEVISPTSGHIDRIVKMREYGAVPSILRYVILESDSIALTNLERTDGSHAWTATAQADDETLRLPELGIEIPLPELYADVDLSP